MNKFFTVCFLDFPGFFECRLKHGRLSDIKPTGPMRRLSFCSFTVRSLCGIFCFLYDFYNVAVSKHISDFVVSVEAKYGFQIPDWFQCCYFCVLMFVLS